MTADERKRKQQKTIRYLSIFMLIILGLSSAGYAFFANPSSGSTNDQTQNNGNQWTIKLGNYQLVLSSSPENAKKIPMNISVTANSYSGQSVYIASENEAVYERVYSALAQYSGKVQKACYGSCTEDLPEKTCADNLIVWRNSAVNKVYQQDKCIFIEGDISSADAFIYKIFGLI